ncbi:MAG: lipoprotein-releasing ABC transporter permease subunit [Rhodospirillaceae bacterium]|nr:lipoprotein-releasing ABC transporter permease subunit [Rhodospirillaceae bacterium]
MFSAFERMMAARYLRARRQEGFISVIAGFSLLGIALGVATLIIVMAVMNGFRQELLGRILGLNGHLTLQSTRGALTDFDTIAGRVRLVPGVVAVRPIIDGQVMATANNVASGALVRGMRPADLAAHSVIAANVVQGNLDDNSGDDAVVIGHRLAQKLGLRVGDSITLISPQGTVTAFGVLPRLRAYRVVATFDIGMYEYDSSFVFMPLPAAQIFFRFDGAVSGLEAIIDDPDRVGQLRQPIVEAAGDSVRMVDWQQVNSSFFNAIQVERNVMFLILTLIILVAAFNIISSLIMLVKDKSRDIAILRTMGATRGMIMRIFFLSGASIGFIGTAAGFVLGLTFCANIESIRQAIESLSGAKLFAAEIYFLSRLPARVEPSEVATVVIMALGLSVLATIYPSWRAARLDPVEALRYE